MIFQTCARIARRLMLPNCHPSGERISFSCLHNVQDDTVRSSARKQLESTDQNRTTGDIPWADLYHEQKGVPLSNKEQRKMKRKKPIQPKNPRLLQVAIIGSPNAGKSTLANKLMGWKFSAVSSKVHTTRHKAQGVMTEGDAQIVFLDTPGMITPSKMKRHNLEKTLLVDPHDSLHQANLVMVIVDVSVVWHQSRLDPLVLMALNMHPNKEVVLILNKVDRIANKQLLLQVTRRLTGGLVDGKQHWSIPGTASGQSVDMQVLFDRMKQNTLKEDQTTQKEVLSDADSVNIDHSVSNNEPRSMDGRGYSATAHSGSQDVHVVLEGMVEEHQKLSGEIQLSTPSLLDEDSLLSQKDGEKDSVSGCSQSKKLLRDAQAWKDYVNKLRTIEKQVKNQSSWQKFKGVFMISALDGDGVWELKKYLLEKASPGPWLYHSSMVTDQDPIEMARMCVWEKLLDHLPAEIPYQIHVVLSLWEIDDDDVLRAVFDIICPKKRHLLYALGKNGQTIRRVAAEAKQELMNTFRRDLTLQLMVRLDKR